MDTTSIRPSVAVIGLGGWGEKLVSAASRLPVRLHGFDIRPSRARMMKRAYPALEIHPSFKHILEDPHILGVVIATTPSTHYTLARAVLLAHKHVLIEKPITQSLREAQQLISLASRVKRIIMVDHTYLFSPAVLTAHKLVAKGIIGKLIRFESIRTHSRALSDSTILWDFAPHDVAVAQLFMQHIPDSVRPLAVPYERNVTLEDATIELNFTESAVRYLSHISWNDPGKERLLTIIGDKGALVLQWDAGREKFSCITCCCSVRYVRNIQIACKYHRICRYVSNCACSWNI